jgi:hypothetical protein
VFDLTAAAGHVRLLDVDGGDRLLVGAVADCEPEDDTHQPEP